jgi:CheY-like chemotaxis protein
VPRAAQAGLAAASAGSTARRVMVVDDNLDSADTLVECLTLMGHATLKAHDGRQAVDAATDFRPEVILLDIGLPGLTGHEVCRRIRGQPWGRRIVMVALTGWGQDEDRRRSREAGFDHHFVKPVDPAVLAELLDALPASAD